MSHGQVVLVVHFLDDNVERLEAEDGDSIGACQELEELLLVFVFQTVEDGPKVDNGWMILIVTLLETEINLKILLLNFWIASFQQWSKTFVDLLRNLLSKKPQYCNIVLHYNIITNNIGRQESLLCIERFLPTRSSCSFPFRRRGPSALSSETSPELGHRKPKSFINRSHRH